MWHFFIPDWLLISSYYFLLFLGIVFMLAGKIAKWVPVFGVNSKLFTVTGVILTCGSLYLFGGYSTDQKWKNKVKALEEKVKIAEENSKKVNEVIAKKVIIQTQGIKTNTKKITEYIDREVIKNVDVIKYIESCPIPEQLIQLHNKAIDVNHAELEGKK